MLNFTRRQNENVDTLITRFELTRFRARQDGGGAQLSTEMEAMLLLRACGVSPDQYLTLPTSGRPPH